MIQTPTLDGLAARGTRFENGFVTTSICAASRATILTGLYEKTHGYTFGEPPLEAGEVEDSYPYLLRAGGYRTGFFGKFGVGVPDNGRGPNSWRGRMFDTFEPINRTPYFKNQPDGTVRHTADLIGDRAVDFISDAAEGEKPWCLSISFNAGHAEDFDKAKHYPYPFAEAGLYADADIPEPRYGRDEWKALPAFFHNSMQRQRYAWRWDTPEKYRRNYINYCRLLTGMDRNIGRMVEAIETSGQTDETVVLFIGDNGYYAGSRGFAGKWSHHEESLRVPLIITDPAATGTAVGQVRTEMALNLDIAPTILDYAGVAIPDSYQGRSLKPLAQSDAAASDWRDDFYIEHRMKHADIPAYEGVRGERWKYARYTRNVTPEDDPDGDGVFEGEFLHDMQADPTERTNLAHDPSHRAKLNELRARTDSLP